MVEIKTPGELDAMREAGRVVAVGLNAMRDKAAVGVSLLDLNEIGHQVLRDMGADSPFLNYQPHFASTPFPAVVCISVNGVVVHGVPDKSRLRDGDLVSLDFGAIVDGWAGDSAVSFIVGTPGRAEKADRDLITSAEEALQAGIAAAVPGGRLGDVSHAIGRIGRDAGYGIPTRFGGHGVGRRMHEDPHVPNDGQAGRGLPLRAGMVIAIEPMFMAGGRDEIDVADDGWSLLTVDDSRAAHVEHTVAITDDGPRILTLP